jgi:predicted amidohydrolase
VKVCPAVQQTDEHIPLITALEEGGDDPVPIVATLWTWLEERIADLASHRVKTAEIAAIAEQKEQYVGITDEVRESLQDDPLYGAAELLARVEQSLGPASWPLIGEAKAFNGEPVLVCWRESAFVETASGVDFNPTSREHPSLFTLAPRLVVSPLVVNQIKLQGERAKGLHWNAALGRLQEELASEEPQVSVHMDTLGLHGLSGWLQKPGALRGHFDKPKKDDLEATESAARKAVERASTPECASLLVLPELSAAESVLGAIKEELRDRPGSPSLTVVGLRHFVPADEEGEREAKYVNEAVILGPRGKELWRHRKLSYAGAAKGKGEYPPLVEDIRVGRTLRIIQTPIGNFAVVICLDCFAEKSEERLAKSPASILLIPSLSPSAKPHRDSLRQLVTRLWAIAFVCNRSPLVAKGHEIWNGYEARSFWVMALSDPEIPPAKIDERAAHPSFVFRMENRKRKNAEKGEKSERAK